VTSWSNWEERCRSRLSGFKEAGAWQCGGRSTESSPSLIQWWLPPVTSLWRVSNRTVSQQEVNGKSRSHEKQHSGPKRIVQFILNQPGACDSAKKNGPSLQTVSMRNPFHRPILPCRCTRRELYSSPNSKLVGFRPPSSPPRRPLSATILFTAHPHHIGCSDRLASLANLNCPSRAASHATMVHGLLLTREDSREFRRLRKGQ
jgi:hypothetical protein